MSPCVGFNPYTPQYEAGRIVDPPVWLPSASGTMPDATAAADPLHRADDAIANEPRRVGGRQPVKIGEIHHRNGAVRCFSKSTSTRRRILPDADFGMASMNSRWRMRLCGATLPDTQLMICSPV